MASATVSPLARILYEDIVRAALLEDLGRAGDLTTDAVVAPDHVTHASIVARQSGRVSGVEVAAAAFAILGTVEAAVLIPDGADAEAGSTIVELRGPARAILTGERTALNLMGRMCGIATLTRSYAIKVQGTGARVVCTRKTTPGLRVLEKYAVRCGGGCNHRFGLDDAILVKDNHVVLAGGIQAAVERVRAATGHMVKIEVEVDTLEQLEAVLDLGVDAVLLDNMSTRQLRRAVAMVAGRMITEASGGITLSTAREIAETGVDLLSVGALTHSAPCLDLSLEICSPD